MPTVEHLLKFLRKRLDDELGSDSQKSWQDWELCRYLTEGQEETNKELLVLTEDSDIIETVASGTITISSGTTGSISVLVNGVTITSAPVPFNTDINTTASDLATAINTYSQSGTNYNAALSLLLQNPTLGINYVATALNNVVTINAPAGTGFTPNGYPITAIVTGDVSYVSTTMIGGSCLCRLFIVPGQTKYQIHQKTYIIQRFKVENIDMPLSPVTKGQMDYMYPNWERMQAGRPVRYIPDYVNKNLIIAPMPRRYHTVDLDVVRFPYLPFTLSNLAAETEIAEEYTSSIIPWAIRQAFLKNDREASNTLKSEKFEKEFYRTIEQTRIIHKIRRNPQASANNHVPNGFL